MKKPEQSGASGRKIMKKIATKMMGKTVEKSCQKIDQKRNEKNDEFIPPKNDVKKDQFFDVKNGVKFLRIPDESIDQFQKRKESHFKLLSMAKKFKIPVSEKYSYPIRCKNTMYYPYFAVQLEESKI